MIQRMTLCVAMIFTGTLAAAEPLTVTVDATAAPELRPWIDDARVLILDWHPRITNVLPSVDFQPARKITVRLRKSNEGVAETANGTVTISSGWLEKHPEDVGLVIHELTHIIQAYPSPQPLWVTEGIADYVRRVVYEGRTLDWFPKPKVEQGYKQSYNVAAGFLFWLETDQAPGIVNRLNTAMRGRKYSPKLFEEQTGKPLDTLWREYVGIAEPKLQ